MISRSEPRPPASLRKQLRGIPCAICLGIVTAGRRCIPRVSIDCTRHYGSLKLGMAYQLVAGVLGRGDGCTSDSKQMNSR